LNPELFNAFAECRARDAEQLGGLHLIVVGFLERLNDQLALDGGDHFQFRIAPGDLEKLPGQIRRVRVAPSPVAAETARAGPWLLISAGKSPGRMAFAWPSRGRGG
jgi:hypothetical protein